MPAPIVMKPKLLISESKDFSSGAVTLLHPLCDVRLEDLDRPGLLAAVADADILWVRLRNEIDRKVMSTAPRLKMIVTATTGLDHIDVAEASRRGISVLSLKGDRDFLVDVKATAELTLALILSLIRRIPAAHAHASSGGWNRDLFKGREIHGATVGIVGLGRVGGLVAERLAPFGATLVAADVVSPSDDRQPSVRRVSLSELLAMCDVVTLHADLTPQTRGLIDDGALASMKAGALLVNTSRGELVEESALIKYLESGHLGGAALDVLADERTSRGTDDPLLAYARSHDNLLITPHIGGCTAESMEKTELHLATKLVDEIPRIFGRAPKTLAGGGS